MTIVYILGDGTSVPHLSEKFTIILIQNRAVFFGKFNRSKYMQNEVYLDMPLNHDDLKEDVVNYVFTECGMMMDKKHPVHILCPKNIAQKMKWEE